MDKAITDAKQEVNVEEKIEKVSKKEDKQKSLYDSVVKNAIEKSWTREMNSEGSQKEKDWKELHLSLKECILNAS